MVGDVEVIGFAQARAWAARVQPPVERLPHGIWSVPVPFPGNPLRYTLSYLLRGDRGLVVVDPGWASDEGWAALTAGLAAADATVSDVVGIVATHAHEDHHGQSGRLAGESGAWIAMHVAEAATLPRHATMSDADTRRSLVLGWLRGCGAPAGEAEELAAPNATHPSNTIMADPDVLVADGEALPLPGRTVRVVSTPGHTPGHVCLLDTAAKVLLTGDHLLPRITPNVGLSPAGESPALASYLASLDRCAEIDARRPGLVALPAHEYRFAGVADRARALKAHHARRCDELLRIVRDTDQPTLWELTSQLTWARPWDQVGPMQASALAETAAHVKLLSDRGELECIGTLPLEVSTPAPDTVVRVRLPRRPDT